VVLERKQKERKRRGYMKERRRTEGKERDKED
jgi:hypothetical protein